ncbi:hypothetical protein SLA2020_453230 [Shorea laevis]
MMRFLNSRGCDKMVNKNKSTCICDLRNFTPAYWTPPVVLMDFVLFLARVVKDVYATWPSVGYCVLQLHGNSNSYPITEGQVSSRDNKW